MGRLLAERLEGYGFAVSAGPVDENGGWPCELVLVDDPARQSHAVTIPLSAEGRVALVRQLTGGLILAPAG